MNDRGFTLLELLASVAITLVVSGGVLVLVSPARATFQAHVDTVDLQQRARVAVDSIYQDLLVAGAGSRGTADVQPLAAVLPAIFPMRRGLAAADPPDTFRADRLTLLAIPPPSLETTIAQDMASASDVVSFAPCASAASCGLVPGANVIVFDDTGAYDTFTITALDPAAQTLSHNPAALGKAYAAGARLAQVTSITYWLDTTVGQLTRYDGFQSDNAVADSIASLHFDYFGEPQPSGGTLVPLDAATLGDGPWMPDASNANRWDADLLRVRQVRVTIEVRAPAGALHIPDRVVVFDVAPRNLNVQR